MPNISVLIKPASGMCNLQCKYCFYCDETKNREVESYGFMEEETLLLLALPEEPLPPVYADPELCLQIFTILLDNAIAYGLKDTGRIILSAGRAQSLTTVCVTDFGPGIGEEDKALIFDPFYRQDKSRNVKAHFGLGLSIAARLAGLQDVSLNVRDTEGGGSTFEVVFNG